MLEMSRGPDGVLSVRGVPGRQRHIDRGDLPGLRAAASHPQRLDYTDFAEHHGLELATEMVLEVCGGTPSEITVAGDPHAPKRVIDFPSSPKKSAI